MFNWIGCDRKMVGEILERQTDLKLAWDGTDAGIDKIKGILADVRPRKKFEMIYNCEFLGFIDDARTRVGCLMHPLLNHGRNLRGYCKYGEEVCGQARCTAYTYFDHDESQAVARAAPDWYLYGLVLGDIDLIKEFFDLADFALYREIPRSCVSHHPQLLQIFSEYLALKETWPYAKDPTRFGKYYFPGPKEYCIAEIDYASLGASKSKYDKVLLSLASVFNNADELTRAEECIRGIIERFADAYLKLTDTVI